MKRGATLFDFSFSKRKKEPDKNEEETSRPTSDDNRDTKGDTVAAVGEDSAAPSATVCEANISMSTSTSDDELSHTPSSSKDPPKKDLVKNPSTH